MSKKLQYAVACILLGFVCLISVNRCTIRPFLRWSRRVPLNKEWLGYRTEKPYAAADVQSIHVANVLTKIFVRRTGASDAIIVHTRGLPDEAVEITLNGGVLCIVEKDAWSSGAFRKNLSSDLFDDWYMDADISIEVPKGKLLTSMQFDLHHTAELYSVESDTVTVLGSGSPTFTAQYCTFGTVTTEREIRIDMSDTVLKSRSTLASKDGSIILKAVTAPAVEISSTDGSFQAERISFDELVCRMEDGSCRIDGAVTQRVDIVSEDGSVRLDLNGTAIAGPLLIRSNDGSVTMENIIAPAAHIQTKDGSIRMEHVRFDTVQCHVHDGSIRLNGYITKNAELTTNNGSINANFNQSSIAEKLHLYSRDGSIITKDVSAPQADIQTEDGQIKMQHCVLHNLTVQAYNNISFDGDLGGYCRLTSRNGNIRLQLQKSEDEYAISSVTGSLGNSGGKVRSIGNITIENTSQTVEMHPIIAGNPASPNKLILSAEDGKITITTKE